MKYNRFTMLAVCLTAVAGVAADDVDKRINDISGKNKQVALDAIDQVGQAGAESAVPALVRALSGKDADLRWHAARALGSIGNGAESAVPQLVKALGDDSPEVRAYAADALGKIGDASDEVVKPLIKTVFDPSGWVRRASLRALRKIDPPQEKILPVMLKILEESEPTVVTLAMSTLAEEGEEAVPRLCTALDHDQACYWACLVLAEIGPKASAAVPHLKKVLDHKDPEVRLEALVALGEIGPASAPLVPDIAEALKNDPIDGVRYAAAYALGMIGTGDAATQTLSQSVSSKDPFLCMLSAWALARNNPDDKAMVQRAIDLIVGAFKSDDVHLRRAAAKAAVDLEVPTDVVAPMLVEALRDTDQVVVGNAIEALAQFGPKALKDIDQLLQNKDLRQYAVLLISRLGPEAESTVPALIAALREKPQDDQDVEFQQYVQLALADIGPGAKEAVRDLIKSLASDDDRICASATYALGRIGPSASKAVPALGRNLKRSNPRVRLTSVLALLQIRPGEPQVGLSARPLLVKGLENEDEVLRAISAGALGQLGTRAKGALPRLKQLLDDESELVRQAAAEAVEKINK